MSEVKQTEQKTSLADRDLLLEIRQKKKVYVGATSMQEECRNAASLGRKLIKK